MNPDEHRPVDPELDTLREAADTAYRKFAEHATVTSAENAVANARATMLRDESTKAFRRISSMRGQVTRAQKDGDAVKIAAAHEKLKQAEADFDRISNACLEEGWQIVEAETDRTATTLALMRESWDAGDAVIEALRRPNERPM
ncbi:hypothetical protein ABT352_32985 [Streptosporangium sp. NPDC000563]|uniref:hypothetical protein n=1 Tax=Streptosporangium sp. NPDC000563 TaxID=3154366 RepID=UPI00331E30AE